MDDRPCTYNFPKQLAEIHGAKAIMPSKKWMGNLEKIADIEKISEFILENTENISGLVIASDTLAYGGLIPSRRSNSNFEDITKNFDILKKVKNNNPDTKLYVCSTVQRISDSNENQEEKDYWKDYGKLIHKYSYTLDRNESINIEDYENGNIEKILSEINEIKELIPHEVLVDYLTGRIRNLNVNKYLIDLVKNNIIDFLVISSDDSSSYGFNVVEKNILKTYIDESLKEKVIMYPGADEAVSVLTGRMINESENFTPKFYVIYSEGSKKDKLITMYEGIELKETINYQIKALGGKIVKNLSEADIVLYLHTGDETQEDQYLNAIYNMETKKIPTNIIEKDIKKIKSLIENHRSVALVDSAYANGGNHNFMINLSKNIDLKNLCSYAGWNTTGNSIGTAIAHSSIRFISKEQNSQLHDKSHYKFLFERFFDDWVYQGYKRLEFIKKEGFPLSQEQLQTLKEDLFEFINTFISDKYQKNFEIEDINFPWNRPFETEVTVKSL